MSDLKLFPFEETELYKKAYAFARKCREIANRLPKGYFSDSDQLKRASLSVINNYSEGYGRWHVKDKQQFYAISRGSAFETIPVISLLHDENQITEEELMSLRNEVAEITRMLSGMIQKLEKRGK